jgi:putative ABC transport system substrate-binding protein
MIRRQFISLLGGAAAAPSIFWPLAAGAQQRVKMLRIGSAGTNEGTEPWWVAFFQRLRELGYVEGQNLAIEYIKVNGPNDLTEAMKELLRRKVDIIVAAGAEAALKVAVAVTDKLPIVMLAFDYDPFAHGYVKSLARPGGNVTGVFLQQIELVAKRVQIFKDAFPEIPAATVFWDRFSADQWPAMKNAGATLGVSLFGVELRDPPYDYEQALAQSPPDHRGALIMSTSPLFVVDFERIAGFALAHRMVSVFNGRAAVEAGGLLSYGPDTFGMWRLAADYVDRIARGEKPADLPIQQPTKFDLFVNLKTAKAIGVTVSTSVLLRAEGVIE